MKNKESEEMYLETILILKNRKGSVRSVDIVEERGYAKSSVSRGVNLLKDKGYIEIDPATGNITFTEAGKKKAEGVYERHRMITKALIKLGAEEHVAEENACRIEHVVSDELMAVLENFIA